MLGGLKTPLFIWNLFSFLFVVACLPVREVGDVRGYLPYPMSGKIDQKFLRKEGKKSAGASFHACTNDSRMQIYVWKALDYGQHCSSHSVTKPYSMRNDGCSHCLCSSLNLCHQSQTILWSLCEKWRLVNVYKSGQWVVWDWCQRFEEEQIWNRYSSKYKLVTAWRQLHYT